MIHTTAKLPSSTAENNRPLHLDMVTLAKDFTVSASAAGLSHILHHPLYTLKSQMMYYGPAFRFRDFLHRSKQPTFLYRGVTARAIGIMPEKAMKMQAWIIVGRYIERNFEEKTYTKWLIAGSAAGAATTVIGCPSERIMVLAQVQKQGLLHVIRSAGISGLYNGWTATLYRDITFNAAFFTLREVFIRRYESYYQEKPVAFARVILGMPAGLTAAVMACPLDVIKTKMQGRPLTEPYQSCSRIFFNIVRNEGPRNLMKGLVPRLIAVPSMMSFFYVINEELDKLFMK